MRIDFEAENHLYALDGVPVPGVTSVLTGLNLVDKSYFTPESRHRGVCVHAAVQYALEGKLKWETLHPRLVGYTKGALKLIETLELVSVQVEKRVGSAKYLVCGCCDFVGTRHGEPTALDWKSGAVVRTTGYQLSGYEICLREEPGAADRWVRIGAQLFEDGSFPKPTFFTSHTDERRFLAALDLYRADVWPREPKYGIASARAVA